MFIKEVYYVHCSARLYLFDYSKNSNILKYLSIYKLKERLSVICISLEPIQWI